MLHWVHKKNKAAENSGGESGRQKPLTQHRNDEAACADFVPRSAEGAEREDIMDLKQATSPKLISLNNDFQTKEEVIRYLADLLDKEGILSSKEEYLKAVFDREKLSETGMDNSLAIPHGKSDAVKRAAFAVASVKKPIAEWESIEETNQVRYIFLLAIPASQAGSTHLDLLAELMTKAADVEYLNHLFACKTSQEFYDELNYSPEKAAAAAPTSDKLVCAITACAAGIAHTYMAAQALQTAGEELGIKVRVEKQGANGTEDRFTADEIEKAAVIITAVDVAVKNPERFAGKTVFNCRVAAPIRDAKGVINAALEKADAEQKANAGKPVNASISNAAAGKAAPKKNFEEKDNAWTEIKRAVMTGISYIIPIIIVGGMLNAFAVLIAQSFHLTELYNLENSWLWLFRKTGNGMLGQLMVPALAAYMSYSLSDKTGLAPGFAAGVAANLINGGFLCGMLGGLLAGYTVRLVRKYIPAKGVFAGFVTFWVYPVLSSVIVSAAMIFVIGKPVAWLNAGLLAFLNSMGKTNAALLGIMLGIMVSFDLGGPVNKAAYAFCVAVMADGFLMPYCAFASIKMVSGFAVTAATRMFPKYFTEEEREAGSSTWILVLAGITEGAIPVMMADPLRVIAALCAGSAVTGAIIASVNIGLDVPGAGIFSLFMLSGGTGNAVLNALIWFFAAVLGAAVSTVVLVLLKKAKYKKEMAA